MVTHGQTWVDDCRETGARRGGKAPKAFGEVHVLLLLAALDGGNEAWSHMVKHGSMIVGRRAQGGGGKAPKAFGEAFDWWRMGMGDDGEFWAMPDCSSCIGGCAVMVTARW